MRRPYSTIVTAGLVLSILGAGPGAASADVLVLKDGTRLDVKVLKEENGWLTVKTIADVKRVEAATIASREPGESASEIYEKLKSKLETNPKDVDSLWKIYVVTKANEPLLPKGEPSRWLQKVLKASPDHELARDAHGEARWEGKWVLKTDLPRLEAEKAREKKRQDWEVKLGVPVTLSEGAHWTLIDNSGDKDPAARAQQLDDAYNKLCEILGVEKLWDGTGDAIAFRKFEPYLHYLEQYQASAKMSAFKFEAAKNPALAGFWNHKPTPFLMRSVPESGDDGMWHAFVHSSVHMSLWTRFPYPPTWLEEGLASHIETAVLGVQKSYCVGMGGKKPPDPGGTHDKLPEKKTNKKGSDLAEAVSEYKDRCIEAMKDGSFPELRKFLRMNINEYTPVEAGGALGLCTWLMQRDAEKFKLIVEALRKKPTKDDAPWKEVYGYEVIEDMEKEWKAWVVGEW